MIHSNIKVIYNEGGDATHVKYYDIYRSHESALLTTIELAATPPTMSTNEIAGLTRAWPSNLLLLHMMD